MIVVIDNYDSFTYNLYQQIAGFYSKVEVVRNDKTTLQEIVKISPKALVISPGPGTPENAGISIELIKKCGPSIPILGVCLGLQAIAVAWGGRVVRAPVCIHGKSAPIFHRREALFSGMKLPFQAARYHSLVVDQKTLPHDLIIEAFSNDDLIMAVRHVRYPIWGVQFHPESILTEEGDRLIENFLKMAQVD